MEQKQSIDVSPLFDTPLPAANVSAQHGQNTPAEPKPGHRWAKGESGNPAGRAPRGTPTLTGELRKQADKRKLAASLLELAYKGDVTALRYVYDRLEGTPVQRSADVTPDVIRTSIQAIALSLGVPEADVQVQYEELRRELGAGA